MAIISSKFKTIKNYLIKIKTRVDEKFISIFIACHFPDQYKVKENNFYFLGSKLMLLFWQKKSKSSIDNLSPKINLYQTER